MPETYDGHFHFRRERFRVEQRLQRDDTGRRQGLYYLISSHGVRLQRQIGENDEPAERQGYRNHLRQRHRLYGEDSEETARQHPERGEDKVDHRERHVREKEIRVHGFVQEYDGYRKSDVKREDRSDEQSAEISLFRLTFCHSDWALSSQLTNEASAEQKCKCLTVNYSLIPCVCVLKTIFHIQFH